jgi:hypothetical protein
VYFFVGFSYILNYFGTVGVLSTSTFAYKVGSSCLVIGCEIGSTLEEGLPTQLRILFYNVVYYLGIKMERGSVTEHVYR